MKYKVRKEEYKKILSEEIDVNIPENLIYFWHNGERVAYSVLPVWTTWNKENYQKDEEIYEFRIVKVDPSFKTISRFSIPISNLSEILSGRGNKNHVRLAENILFYPEENTRTKEQFLVDYNTTFEDIESYLTLENL